MTGLVTSRLVGQDGDVTNEEAETAAMREAVNATVGRLTALDEADQCQHERHEAYVKLRDLGYSHRGIAEALRAELTELGWTPSMVARAGISHDSVTLALSPKPKRKKRSES